MDADAVPAGGDYARYEGAVAPFILDGADLACPHQIPAVGVNLADEFVVVHINAGVDNGDDHASAAQSVVVGGNGVDIVQAVIGAEFSGIKG